MLFFFNDTATAEIYTLSLHDALPIYGTSKTTTFTTLILRWAGPEAFAAGFAHAPERRGREPDGGPSRSAEHTSELQSQSNLVCRLLLEKNKKMISETPTQTRTQSAVA